MPSQYILKMRARKSSHNLEHSVTDLIAICLVIADICAAVFYIIYIVRPRHVHLKAIFGRFASIDFEAHGEEPVKHETIQEDPPEHLNGPLRLADSRT